MLSMLSLSVSFVREESLHRSKGSRESDDVRDSIAHMRACHIATLFMEQKSVVRASTMATAGTTGACG
jgi:hypothetical protein